MAGSVPIGERAAWWMLLAFGLVLTGVGLWLAGEAIARGLHVPDAIGASLCLVGGAATLVGGTWVRRRTLERHALRLRDPDRPWLWRREWAEGRIGSTARGDAMATWLFTVLWNLLSLPVLLGYAKHAIFFAWIFPAFGAVLLVAALRLSFRARSAGRSVLVLETLPGVIGGDLRAALLDGPDAPDLLGRLTCSRAVFDSEEELWRDERRVAPERIAFEIPDDLPPTEEHEVTWRLELRAERYRVSFEVPIFETGGATAP